MTSEIFPVLYFVSLSVKGCQYLQKAVAAYTGKKGWDKELKTCLQVLACSRKLVSSILLVNSAQQLQLANSARLALTSSLKIMEQSQTSISTGELVPELTDEFKLTKEAVQHLLNKIAELNKTG